MNIRKITFWALFVMLIASQSLFAQVADYSTAVQLARNKKYSKALEIAEKILAADPKNVDVLVLMANVNSWDHKYTKAKSYIEKAYQLDQSNQDLYDSWLNILLWDREPQALQRACDIAESHQYPNKYNLFVKRLQADELLRRYKSVAKRVESEENKAYRDSALVVSLYREAREMNHNNFISAHYILDFFDKDQPQHLLSAEYSFQSWTDRIIFRANGAHRFGINGLQLEADYYKIFKNDHYLYLNYGYSIDNPIFPQHRAGAEYFVPLKSDFGASLGGRYLHFPQRDIYIATGTVSKYLGKSWFSVRPFYSIQDNGNSVSVTGNFRRFTKGEPNYWGLELGYGNSPDDRFAVTQNSQFFRLASYRAKVERNFTIGNKNEFNIGAAAANEEFVPGSYRNRYTIDLIYKIKL
jgi:YaiO family outer membrane protein